MGGRDGHPADLDALQQIARKHGVQLIEDSAHAHGSEWRGKKIGTFGTAATFSFQSSKLMTAGEGGIIISNDDGFERQARSVHDCGRMPGEWFYAISFMDRITASANGRERFWECN